MKLKSVIIITSLLCAIGSHAMAYTYASCKLSDGSMTYLTCQNKLDGVPQETVVFWVDNGTNVGGTTTNTCIAGTPIYNGPQYEITVPPCTLSN